MGLLHPPRDLGDDNVGLMIFGSEEEPAGAGGKIAAVYDSTLNGNADIVRIPIGGGQQEPLTRDPADDFAADLSPDGRFISADGKVRWAHGRQDRLFLVR